MKTVTVPERRREGRCREVDCLQCFRSNTIDGAGDVRCINGVLDISGRGSFAPAPQRLAKEYLSLAPKSGGGKKKRL